MPIARAVVGLFVDNDGIRRGQDFTAELREIRPVEDHEHLHQITLGEDGIGADPNGTGRLPTTDLGSIGFDLHHVQPDRCAGLRQHVSRGDHTITTGTDDCKCEIPCRHLWSPPYGRSRPLKGIVNPFTGNVHLRQGIRSNNSLVGDRGRNPGAGGTRRRPSREPPSPRPHGRRWSSAAVPSTHSASGTQAQASKSTLQSISRLLSAPSASCAAVVASPVASRTLASSRRARSRVSLSAASFAATAKRGGGTVRSLRIGPRLEPAEATGVPSPGRYRRAADHSTVPGRKARRCRETRSPRCWNSR